NKKKEIQTFLKQKAKFLKELTNPRVSKTNYNRDDLQREISSAKKLETEEVKKCEKILKTEDKEEIDNYKLLDFNFEKLHNQVLGIINYELNEIVSFEELNKPNKKEFAEKGLSLHNPGDKCLFCGNIVENERYFKLEKYFKVDEINDLRSKVNILIGELDNVKNSIKSLQKNDEIYFEHLREDLSLVEEKYKSVLLEERNYIDNLIGGLKEKCRTPYSNDIAMPNLIESEYIIYIKEHNKIIEKHNLFAKNIKYEQEQAEKRLRYHYISVIIEEKKQYNENWKGYIIENTILQENYKKLEKSLKDLQDEIKKLEGNDEQIETDNLKSIKNNINKLSIERSRLLESVQSTEKWVNIINDKLKKIGKTNLKLCLEKNEDNVEHYVIHDDTNGTREITKLSTGEKNIISFLYFMESLVDIRNDFKKNKIIIFDDPMNSNDDTMQYIIIQELLNLYRGKNSKKFNPSKDYFICLTHNVHFYLNIQPYGEQRKQVIKNGKKVEETKYTKMNFYIIENKRIMKISNVKEDLNTHYDSLWIELKEMYELKLINSMLNSMRRILETIIKFNGYDQNKFYENDLVALKLFNVNSHSIDDLTADMIGNDVEELLRIFREMFKNNNIEDHFNKRWN
ncbi:AAA family ATPase, partial [Staphylococcus aureus]|nr:AAA family ATPase [Staphylococcus aureus]